MKRWLLFIKIAVMVGAYGYLAYALSTFEHYPELNNSICTASATRWLCLAAVLVLMPFNLLMEALKWRCMVSQVQEFSLMKSFRSVLMGMASGFFTPNRISDPVGRVLLMDEGNRAKGVMFFLVGSVAQSFAVCFYLVVPLVFLLLVDWGYDAFLLNLILGLGTAFILLVTVVYFTIPLWAGKMHSRHTNIESFFRAVDSVSYRVLLKVSALSIIRYAVFSSQFYLALLFMGLDLDPMLVCMAIPLNYFLVTITPSVSFSELGVRALFAYIIMGVVTLNPEEAAVAASLVWFINNVIPMVVGSVLVARHKMN